MGYDIKNLAKVTKAFFIWVFFIFLSHNTTKAFPALKKTYPKKGTSTTKAFSVSLVRIKGTFNIFITLEF